MGEEVFTVSLAALLALGFRHGFDADHLAAVSSLISKRRQHILDAVGIGGAFAFGHSLSAIIFGVAGAVLGLGVKALTPGLLDQFAGVLAGVLVIILGVWIVRGCVSGRCYEKRSRYRMISFSLPEIEPPNHRIFKMPLIGLISTILYKCLYKILYSCSICLSNWVGFLFSISPPIPTVSVFLVSVSTGNLFYGLISVLVYGVGILSAMTLVGAVEGTVLETMLKRSLKMHDRMIAALGVTVLLFGVWFLLAQIIDWIPAPWEHY